MKSWGPTATGTLLNAFVLELCFLSSLEYFSWQRCQFKMTGHSDAFRQNELAGPFIKLVGKTLKHIRAVSCSKISGGGSKDHFVHYVKFASMRTLNGEL